MNAKAKIEEINKKKEAINANLEQLDKKMQQIRQEYQKQRLQLVESFVELNGQEKLLKEMEKK